MSLIVPKVTPTDYLNGGFSETTLSDIEDLGAIKTLSFYDYTGRREKSVSIHDDLTIFPVKLYQHQNIINITENISNKLNVEIRFAITDDLVNYYNYINGSFVSIQNIENGMPLNVINNINLSSWFGDIGIAVSIQEKSLDKVLEANDLFIMLNKNINIMSQGVYKINFGTLIDVDIGNIVEATNNSIDSIFS